MDIPKISQNFQNSLFRSIPGLYTGKGGLAPDFTLAVWVFRKEGGGGHVVGQHNVGNRYEPGLSFHCSTRMEFKLPSSGSAESELMLTDSSFAPDIWAFYVVTAQREGNNTVARLYRDGRFVQEGTQVGNYRTPSMNDSFLFMGYPSDQGNRNQWVGTIDDVRVWKKALDAEQIRML